VQRLLRYRNRAVVRLKANQGEPNKYWYRNGAAVRLESEPKEEINVEGCPAKCTQIENYHHNKNHHGTTTTFQEASRVAQSNATTLSRTCDFSFACVQERCFATVLLSKSRAAVHQQFSVLRLLVKLSRAVFLLHGNWLHLRVGL